MKASQPSAALVWCKPQQSGETFGLMLVVREGSEAVWEVFMLPPLGTDAWSSMLVLVGSLLMAFCHVTAAVVD